VPVPTDPKYLIAKYEASPTDVPHRHHLATSREEFPVPALREGAPDTLLVFYNQTSKDLDSEIKHQWMQRCCWPSDYNLCVTAEGKKHSAWFC